MGKQSRADDARTQDAGTQDVGAQEPRTRGMTPAMRWVIGVVAVIVAAGLGWAIWTSTLAGQDPAGSAASSSSAGVAAPTTGPSPGATAVDGSEVIAPDPQQTDSARLPALPQPTPLVAAPLPADAAEQGSLVTGFPTEVAAPTAQSDIIDSSVTSDGTTMQAALNARTDQTPDELADHYRALWAGLGLAPVTSEGSTLAYADQFTSITLAAAESGTGTVYTLYATLRTE